MKTLLTAVVVALPMSVGVSGQAATVLFRLYTDPFAQGANTFRVTAEVRGQDAYGVVAYGVQLVGNAAVPTGSILTTQHNSLRGTDIETISPGGDPGPAGFTLLRSADDTNAATGSNAISITASQDTTDPAAHLIRGFGMEASNAAAKGLVGAFPEGNPWGNGGFSLPHRPVVPAGEFEIARGTLAAVPGGLSAIDFLPVPTSVTYASVFTSPQGLEVKKLTKATYDPFERTLTLSFVPEPATAVGMGTLVLLGLAVFRRRK
jgi:hypothetical protein